MTATITIASRAISIIRIMQSINLSVIIVFPKYRTYFIVRYEVASILLRVVSIFMIFSFYFCNSISSSLASSSAWPRRLTMRETAYFDFSWRSSALVPMTSLGAVRMSILTNSGLPSLASSSSWIKAALVAGDIWNSSVAEVSITLFFFFFFPGLADPALLSSSLMDI